MQVLNLCLAARHQGRQTEDAGVDIGLSDDLFESFVIYQRKIAKEFATMEAKYVIVRINRGNPIPQVNE